MSIQFRRFFSVDSPKAIKANSFGWLNAINYMAPAATAGLGDFCPDATDGCRSICLGEHSGQAAMRKEGETNKVIESRKRKNHYFMNDRQAFMKEAAFHVAKIVKKAKTLKLKPAIRMNGAWDIPFEGVSFHIDKQLGGKLSELCGKPIKEGFHKNIMAAFPFVQFLDYTKHESRFLKPLPENYHLTFSLSEKPESPKEARFLLEKGFNVAAVFANGLPKSFMGFPVINGDLHDLRFLDPQGVIVGLTPKGHKAKKDTSGFIIRN